MSVVIDLTSSPEELLKGGAKETEAAQGRPWSAFEQEQAGPSCSLRSSTSDRVKREPLSVSPQNSQESIPAGREAKPFTSFHSSQPDRQEVPAFAPPCKDEEEDECLVDFRSHLSRFAGAQAASVRAKASGPPFSKSRDATIETPKRKDHSCVTPKSEPRKKRRPSTQSMESPLKVVQAGQAKGDGAGQSCKKPKRQRQTQANSEGDAESGKQDDSPRKKAGKKGLKAPCPQPLDLSAWPSAKFAVLADCPFCNKQFSIRQTAIIRRGHLQKCAAIESLTSEFTMAMLDEEVLRLDREEQWRQHREQEERSTWDHLLASTGFTIRDTDDEAVFNALCIPRDAARRKKNVIKITSGSVEDDAVAKRWKRMDGPRVSLLERASTTLVRSTAYHTMASLCGPKSAVMVRPDIPHLSQGDVDEDATYLYYTLAPTFSCPGDQHLAEERLTQALPFGTQRPSALAFSSHPSRLARTKGPDPFGVRGLGWHDR